MCDQSLNLTNCDERSSSSSTSDTETTDNSQSDNTETPLIIPDISPTSKDLDDAMTDGDRGTTVPDATDEVSDDNDESENSIDENLILTEMTIKIRAIAKAGLVTVKLS